MIQHEASVIETVQETVEVLHLQLDRVVGVAVGIQRQTTDDPMFRQTQGRVQEDG